MKQIAMFLLVFQLSSLGASAAERNIIDDLSRIKIGMSYEDVKKVRPAIEPRQINIDTDSSSAPVRLKGPMVTLEQMSTHTWFSTSICFFTDGHLTGFSMSRLQDDSTPVQLLGWRNDIVAYVVSSLGPPTDMAVLEMDFPHIGKRDVPVTIWKRKDGLIVLALPTAQHGPYAAMAYGLHLVSPANAPHVLSGRKPVSRKETNKFFHKVGIKLPGK